MLNNLPVKTRLTLLVSLLTVFMISVGVIGLYKLETIKGRLQTVYEDRTIALVQLGEVMDKLQVSRGRVLSAMIADDTATAAHEVEGIAGFLEKGDKEWAAYMATSMTAEEKALATDFGKLYKTFHEEIDKIKPVAALGDKAKTAEIMTSIDFRKTFNACREGLNKLAELQAREAKAEFEGGIADYNAARMETIATIIAGLLIGQLIAMGIIRSITGPLNSAVETAQHIAQGDLTHPVSTDAKAEMGRLLDAMDRMQRSLKEVVSNIQRDAHQLSATATSLADSSTEVAKASGLQSDASSSIAAAVEEMTVSISHISARTNDTRSLSIESGDLSKNGARISSQTTESMRQIANTVNVASGQIEDLSHKIDRVSGIVNVIKDIADQTNLLALNAAIEAARAGEQGRGFAVVADEVRKLAERTSQSTQEIGNVINEILAAAAVSVQGMKTSVEQVHQGVTLSEEAGETIERIHTMESRVVEAVNEIADALKEQSAASTDIAQQIERIAQATEENNSAIASTAQSSQTVNSLGKSLLDAVARFKV